MRIYTPLYYREDYTRLAGKYSTTSSLCNLEHCHDHAPYTIAQ
jgi:hypothetical protein